MRRKGTNLKWYIPSHEKIGMYPAWPESSNKGYYDVVRGNWTVYTGNKENANKIMKAFLDVGVHGHKGYESRLESANPRAGRRVI